METPADVARDLRIAYERIMRGPVHLLCSCLRGDCEHSQCPECLLVRVMFAEARQALADERDEYAEEEDREHCPGGNCAQCCETANHVSF
jgi:hypothetical protein